MNILTLCLDSVTTTSTNLTGDEDLIRQTFADTFDLQPATVKFRVQVEVPGRYFAVHIDRNRYKAWDQEPEMRYERVAEQQQHKIFVTFMAGSRTGTNIWVWKTNSQLVTRRHSDLGTSKCSALHSQRGLPQQLHAGYNWHA
jgi:hypothetical protein